MISKNKISLLDIEKIIDLFDRGCSDDEIIAEAGKSKAVREYISLLRMNFHDHDIPYSKESFAKTMSRVIREYVSSVTCVTKKTIHIENFQMRVFSYIQRFLWLLPFFVGFVILIIVIGNSNSKIVFVAEDSKNITNLKTAKDRLDFTNTVMESNKSHRGETQSIKELLSVFEQEAIQQEELESFNDTDVVF